eukprot:SAG22_NODE_566_length_9044_cov_4.581107_2_plen_128_part_00
MRTWLQLALCEIVTKSESEKVSQALCLRKLEIMRSQWDSELFGLRLAVPVGHCAHGAGLAVHPSFLLTGLVAVGSELTWVALRVLVVSAWAPVMPAAIETAAVAAAGAADGRVAFSILLLLLLLPRV